MCRRARSSSATPRGRSARCPTTSSSTPGSAFAELAERWSLELGEPFAADHAAVVATRLPDGREAVLKVTPASDREADGEGDALERWRGRGAVALLAQDRERRAVLLERARPGTPLLALPEEEALPLAAGVLRALAVPLEAGHPFPLLADRARRWERTLPRRWEACGRPFERALLDAALDALRALVPTQPETVLLHQDLHAGNVLRGRDRWLAIDPKPLAGERAFDAAALIRDRRDELARDPSPARRVRRRLDVLAAELGLDRERLRGWALAHTLAWAWEGGRVLPTHVECARLLAAAGGRK